MKKVLITCKSFTGAIALEYGIGVIGDRSIVRVDFGEADLTDVQKEYLLQRIPVQYGEGFEQCFPAGKFQFAYTECEVEFERDFWIKYGKKINKLRAQKVFDQLSVADKALCVGRIPAYIRHLSRNSWKTQADPENFIRKRMFETDWDNVV